ncbi:MAG: hypothetical protein ABI405_13260 [Parafilimonas sp.]
MKKQLCKYLLAMFILLGVGITSQAQTRVYVKVRPAVVVTERPVAPHTNYLWIGDEWTVRNGAYVHEPGYWAAPRAGRQSLTCSRRSLASS